MSSVKDTATPKLKRASRRMGSVSKKIEAGVAEAVLKRAQEIVPVVTGELRDSGETQGDTVRFTAKHALPIHELPSSQGYKFLQRAADEVAEEAFMEQADDELLDSLFDDLI